MASETGLTAAEVAERVARGEVNAPPRSDFSEYLDIVWRNVFTLFNGLVVPAAVALIALGEVKEGLGVSGMALTILVLGLVQEIRAKWHLDHLALLTENTARVLRDGKVQSIPAGEIVRGDHLLLAAGDPVLADGTLVEADYLEVDEALLTGESDPVAKKAGEAVLSGSFCVAGTGRYVADKVGAEGFAQQTTLEARQYRHAPSDLQIAINRTLQILTGVAIALCLVYFALWLARPFAAATLFEMIAATITTMIPSGLVLMATLAFVLGAIRMSARGALVQQLNAVESMASINLLCLDKTGTLTTGNLQVASVTPLGGKSDEDARAALRLFVGATGDGNKTVQALSAELGRTEAEARDLLPFKSQNRYSAVRVADGDRERVLVLGAAEALGPLCEGDWEKPWRERLPSGLRLLLFAEAVGVPRDKFGGSLEGYRLVPVALVALRDELRPEAAAVLRDLAEQGVGFKIISGDNAETVRATVAPLGLPGLSDAPVVTGADLEAAADPGELIRTHSVFGRVAPRQKLRIVRFLQGEGYRVGMVGDGVNDVLPIKNATLGVAMGEGSSASKTVSGIVLESNDFRLLPAVLEEGRTILRNLRRACKLFLVKNLYMLVLIVGMLALFGTQAFPFKPLQVTLLNAITIGLPAVLLIADRDRGRPGRWRGFLTEVLSFVVRTGLVVGAAGLVLVGRVYEPGSDGFVWRTQLLGLIMLLSSANFLRLLADGEPPGPASPGDRLLRGVGLLPVPIFLLFVYTPVLAWFFDLAPPDVAGWGLVLAVAAGALAVQLLLDGLVRFSGEREASAP